MLRLSFSYSSYIIITFCNEKRKKLSRKTPLRGGIRFAAVSQCALTDKMRASQLVTEIKAVIMNRATLARQRAAGGAR